MTPSEQFATMRLLKSRVETNQEGDLVRIETRKCDRTGLVLTRRFEVEPSRGYLVAR